MTKNIAVVSIIDDDAFFQFSTKKVLEASQSVENILQFHDGEQAIEYFIANKDDEEKIPDLVFLDLNMPYMDGWQFLDEFTAHVFKKDLITIYICTSSASKIDREKFRSYPQLKGYLIKPIIKTELVKALAEELGLSADQQVLKQL